jgi:hypothetical protein
MIRAVEYDSFRTLLRRCPDSYDVESAVAQKHGRLMRKPADPGRVQHLDFDSGSGGNDVRRPFRRLTDRQLLAGAVTPPQEESRTRQHESEKDPPADLHLRLFQSATVSGKM